MKSFCGTYTNQTYGFDPHTGLKKVVARVLVGNIYLPWVWRRGNTLRGIKDEGYTRGGGTGGFCGRIKDEIAMMERVEYNTTIVRIVLNKYYIEDFSSL